jgi:adenylate cyclase
VGEIHDHKLKPNPEQTKFIAQFEKGFDYYLNMNFTQAKKIFMSLQDGWPPYRETLNTYIERCDAFIKTPPPDDWTGIYTLTSK